jgi:acyl phosphate:glycerol-3-phosphate acyltransferase
VKCHRSPTLSVSQNSDKQSPWIYCTIYIRNQSIEQIDKGRIMEIEIAAASLLIGYLFGSISVSRIVTKIFAPNIDLTKVRMKDQGTGEDYYLTNVGATTASISLGPKIGGLIGVLDILKGVIPPLVIRLILPDQPYYLFAGIAVVTGHIWTLYHRFRGGGGLSPALGVFLVVDPLGMLLTNLMAMFLGFVVFREFLVAITAGTWLMIPWLWLTTGRWELVLFALLINLMLVVAIIPDVRRYINARRTGGVSMEGAMEDIPMGRMMNRMMARWGLKKRNSAPPIDIRHSGGEQ